MTSLQKLTPKSILADLLKDKLCPGTCFCFWNVRKHNSLNNPCFYSNLCTESYYEAIKKVIYFPFTKTKKFIFWKLIVLSTCFWSQPKMSRILDPRILPFRSSASWLVIANWLGNHKRQNTTGRPHDHRKFIKIRNKKHKFK
jgi:hypothetical protein